MNLYISGSMAYDRIMDFPGKFSDFILPDKIHILNVCFTVNGLVEKFGGTAGNIAYSLRLLGERAVIIATIGKDYGAYFDWLRENDIPIDGITVIPDEFTAGAYITTDRADNQITGFNPGAMKHATSFDAASLDPAGDIVLLAPGNLKDMTDYAGRCRDQGIRFICDPGQSLTQWEGERLRDWIKGSMMLISNDYELEVIMKMTGLDKEGLLAMTGAIITTFGEKGSMVSTESGSTSIPAAKAAEIVDPTGAGDAYRAGLLKGLSLGKNLVTAAKVGAVVATYAIERYGTQAHRFSYGDFLGRYQESFGPL